MRRRFGQGVKAGGAADGAISRNSRGVLTTSRPYMTEKFEEIYAINLRLNMGRDHKFQGRQSKHLYRAD